MLGLDRSDDSYDITIVHIIMLVSLHDGTEVLDVQR
jgi:hypothetical protein